MIWGVSRVTRGAPLHGAAYLRPLGGYTHPLPSSLLLVSTQLLSFHSTQGKLFLGGIDGSVSTDAINEYCGQCKCASKPCARRP